MEFEEFLSGFDVADTALFADDPELEDHARYLFARYLPERQHLLTLADAFELFTWFQNDRKPEDAEHVNIAIMERFTANLQAELLQVMIDEDEANEKEEEGEPIVTFVGN